MQLKSHQKCFSRNCPRLQGLGEIGVANKWLVSAYPDSNALSWSDAWERDVKLCWKVLNSILCVRACAVCCSATRVCYGPFTKLEESTWFQWLNPLSVRRKCLISYSCNRFYCYYYLKKFSYWIYWLVLVHFVSSQFYFILFHLFFNSPLC